MRSRCHRRGGSGPRRSRAYARGRIASARGTRVPEPAGLAVRKPAVAADVAVLGPHDHVHGVLGSNVPDLPHRRRIDPGGATGLQQVGGPVAELDLEPAAMAEVELLLLVMEVTPGLVSGREG